MRRSMNLAGECGEPGGCNRFYADDPNHHHHDISHTHPFDDIGHAHDNLLEDGRVMYVYSGSESQVARGQLAIMKDNGSLIQVWPEVSE